MLDDAGRPVHDGEIGRICVQSRLEFQQYSGGGVRTRLAGFADSGDLGHVDRHGLLHVDGRTDDMVVVGGENVVLTSVEAVVLEHPGVAEARVDAVPDAEWGARLVARVVPTGDASIEVLADEVMAHAGEQLATFARPREVVLVDALEQTSTGKPRRARSARSD